MPDLQSQEHEYVVDVVWTGSRGAGTADYAAYGREHVVRIAGKPELAGSADARFRGDAALHNPEDLFVAAVSACHMLAYLALCARAGVRVLSYEARASGVLALLPRGGGAFREIVLEPVVTIAADGAVELAERLHDDAHARCFIASSCRVPIRCVPRVEAAPPLSAGTA